MRDQEVAQSFSIALDLAHLDEDAFTGQKLKQLLDLGVYFPVES